MAVPNSKVIIDVRVRDADECASSESEEWDDPGDTLTVPEADTSTVKMLQTRSPSQSPSPTPKEETDSDAVCSNDRPESDEEEDLHQEWNASLYMLQSRAPVAKCVYTDKEIDNCPPHYGKEYHGHLSRGETSDLLGTEDGAYLVRINVTEVTVLSFRMNDRVYNYRLFYEDGLHYMGDNRFDVLNDLVQDCLIILYLQHHNVAQTMQQGQVQSMARRKRVEKKLKLLKRSHGRRVKGLKGRKAWEYHRTISNTSLTSVRSPSPTPSPVNSPSVSPTLSPRFALSDLSDTEQNPSPMLRVKSAKSAREGVHSTSTDESNLDFTAVDIRRSTPNLQTPTEAFNDAISGMSGKRRTSSVSSLPVIKIASNETTRYSNIVSILRDAVNQDKKRENLKLNSPAAKLRTSKSDSKVGKLGNNLGSQNGGIGSLQTRTHSCHVPFATSLDRIMDVSMKGTSTLSKSSMTALARHTSGPKSPYYKAHQFAVHTYNLPTWCEVCHHFLWGLKHQGTRCKDCGMDIHKQCVPLAIQLECFPNKQCIKRVYGTDLTTLVKLEGSVIPKVLDDLFTNIQSRDLSIEGIYRVSGQTSEVLYLKEKYDEGESVDLSQTLDISILAGAVKLYFRELPIPLITFDAYTEIMKVTAAVSDPEDHNHDWQPFTNALKLLPKVHYATLQHLAQHLHEIHLHSLKNKMTAHNLSVVFAPTLMRSPDDSNSLIRDLPLQRNFIEYVILKNDIIFR